MQFESKSYGDITLITVAGRIDAVNVPSFEEKCAALLENGMLRAVIDLSGLEYISSAGLRGILSIAKLLRSKHGDICFCGLRGMVQDIFAISGFTPMFPVFDTVEEALKA